jgi:hypothetical protein
MCDDVTNTLRFSSLRADVLNSDNLEEESLTFMT